MVQRFLFFRTQEPFYERFLKCILGANFGFPKNKKLETTGNLYPQIRIWHEKRCASRSRLAWRVWTAPKGARSVVLLLSVCLIVSPCCSSLSCMSLSCSVAFQTRRPNARMSMSCTDLSCGVTCLVTYPQGVISRLRYSRRATIFQA